MDYSKLADKDTIEKTKESLVSKGYDVSLVKNKEEALDKVKALVPQESSVMNGASVTLEAIGLVDYLKTGNHGWDNLHEKIFTEEDMEKQGFLRRQSTISDYYFGSVHALTQEGEMVIGSNTGSQLPHIVYTSPNLIFVVSTKKLVPNLTEAMKRLEEYVIPLEDKRMQEAMGVHTALNKIVIFKNEAKFLGRKIHVILVEEDLGF